MASYLAQSILRTSAVALAFMLGSAAAATAQSPNGVRCTDGFLATTAAICDKSHRGVAADAPSPLGGGTIGTGTAPTNGHRTDSYTETHSIDMNSSVPVDSPSGRPKAAPHPPNPWSAAVTTTPVTSVVQPPATGTGGNPAGQPSWTGTVLVPPVTGTPPDTTTNRQQKPKSP
jgi:hypothetical protein